MPTPRSRNRQFVAEQMIRRRRRTMALLRPPMAVNRSVGDSSGPELAGPVAVAELPVAELTVADPRCPECGRLAGVDEAWLDEWRCAYLGTIAGHDPPAWCPECWDTLG
jgi:hypothetical protein